MDLVLALLAAAANALATVLQRIGVEDAGSGTGTRNLVAGILRRPVWLLGLGLAAASFLLQATALSLGDLSAIQPIMVTELVFLLVILSVWFHHALGWKEWLGTVGTAVGLGVFLGSSDAGGGHARPTPTDWILLLVASVGAVVLAVVAAQRGPRWWRASAYGVGGGIAFALTAAFVKTAADQWTRGPLHAFAHWQAYSVAVAGIVGLVLSQHALQAGPVAASQSALLVVNPLSSIVMGVWLFGDHLHVAGARLGLEAGGLVAMFACLLVLAGSPLVNASAEEDQLTRSRAAARLEQGAS